MIRLRSFDWVRAGALACAVLGCTPGGSERPPDVLLITIDTLRADHLGTYGFPFGTSPEIDAFAGTAVVFERAIAGAGRTIPAHASILTSRYTREHSIGYLNGASHLEGQATLADHFAEAGYATAAFVGNVLFTRDTGLDRGFDVFDAELDSSERNRPHVAERIAAHTAERALAWLTDATRAQPRKPVFLWVHFQDPHGPYAAPGENEGRFELPSPEGEKPLPFADDNEGHGIPAYQATPGLDRKSQYRSRYADEIFYADRYVGELVREFDALTQEPGIVLLTADHGESFGENGRYFVHTYTTTPDVAHVPFILRAPGLAPGRRSEVVHHVDILPTLLELAELPPAADASGVPLAPMLRGEQPAPDRYVFCDNGSQLSAYRGDAFSIVTGLESAWDVSPGNSIVPGWLNLRWDGDWRRKTWSPLPDRKISEEVRRYATRVRPMKPLPPAEQEFLEKLRAMGYVEE